MPSPASSTPSRIEPERALRLGVGAAVAPLWAAFFAAAGAGVTYWWMTAWTRRQAAPAEPKSFASEAEETVVALQPEPMSELVAEVLTETVAVAPEEMTEQAPVVAGPVTAQALPAEITPADPVERAIEAGKDAAETKPRKKASRKAKA